MSLFEVFAAIAFVKLCLSLMGTGSLDWWLVAMPTVMPPPHAMPPWLLIGGRVCLSVPLFEGRGMWEGFEGLDGCGMGFIPPGDLTREGRLTETCWGMEGWWWRASCREMIERILIVASPLETDKVMAMTKLLLIHY